MLRPLLAVALLALASALPAYAATPALPTAPAAAPAIDLPADPFQSNPVLAARLVMEHGYADAARKLQDRSSAEAAGESEAAAESDDGPELDQHSFMPLGDADGDGRDDVVLMTVLKGGEGTIRYQALASGQADKVLWEFETDRDAYAYIVGDVDEDGVLDLQRLTEGESSESGDGYGSQESTADVAILSGKDLSEMANLQVTSRSTYSYTEPEPLPVGRATQSDSYAFEYLTDLDERAGLARMTFRFEFSQSQDRIGPVSTSADSSFNHSMAAAILAPDGSPVWSFDEAGMTFDTDEVDATGDGVADAVVRTSDDLDASYSYGIVPFVDPPRPPPGVPDLFGAEEKPRAPFEVRLLDGADGKPAWSLTLGNASFAGTWWLGDVYGEGPVLFVYTIDLASSGITERSLLVNGATGAILRELDGLSLHPLGDANGDGKDDVLAFGHGDDEVELVAKDGELNELWTLEVPAGEDDDFALLDLDGDGVLDVTRVSKGNLTVFSGTTGEAAWSRRVDDVVDRSFAPGLTNEDAYELGLLSSGAADDESIAKMPADLVLVRGADGAPLWTKRIFDPEDYEPVAADDAVMWIARAGDLNGDGTPDFIVEVLQGRSVHMETSCDGTSCETTKEDSRDDDTGQPLSIHALVDGASGATYARYDDMILLPKVKVVKEDPVEVAPAAQEIIEQNSKDAPGPAFIAALAALGVALAVLRRRKA